jgi:hypothetical protein
MRRMLAVALLVPVVLLAEEKPAAKPNTLTPKEIADGWISLFDGETTFGWKIDGEAKVEKGVLILGGTKETTAEPTTAFHSFHVSFDAAWEGETAPKFGPIANLKMAPSLLSQKEHGRFGGPFSFVTAKVDQFTQMEVTTPHYFDVPAGSKLKLRSVKIRPQSLHTIFNDKDLTGWKVFKGNPKQEKSKWSVTKEGWLQLKDGPGDLQTEALYDDFVLQLECKTNGKQLNSGVFFRCIPGKYQQGYEAQIHNNFTADPPRKYNVEEYDPKTHKQLGKKVVESAAVDFGTGAIYRRVPARKGIAKDGEWFTMTVVARGRHIATWVNGVQVVDWTDNRPAKDNAREGYRDAAGAISLQGHDPTTDLSFRNIRIAKLPR